MHSQYPQPEFKLGNSKLMKKSQKVNKPKPTCHICELYTAKDNFLPHLTHHDFISGFSYGVGMF